MPLDLSLPPKLWLPPKPAIIRAWKWEELKLGFIPGFMPPGAAAAKAVLTTLTQVGSGTSTAANGAITSSVTLAAGDLLVFWGRGSGATTAIPPGSGIAASISDTSTLRLGVYFKLATGSEGTAVTGASGATSARNLLYVFRGNVPVTAAVANDPGTELAIGDPAAQTVTSGSGTPPLVVVGAYESSGAVDPRTFTVGGVGAKDGEISAAANVFWLAYKIYNAAPANVVVDMADEGSGNNLISCYITCS